LLRIVRGNNKDIPDDILLQKYRNTGDIELIGELFSRYMHLVYGVCLKYLKNREDAKDAVLEIFEKLVIEYKIYHIRDMKSWMYVLTKNYCLMELRKRQSDEKKHRKLQETEQFFMESAYDPHPIDTGDEKMAEALSKCIERLKEEQKACIRLFYYENRSYREIAAQMNFDEKKVKSHLQNAKRNLKICLEERNVKEEQIQR
jgi:RNA polymerase sigma-70 factor (ECF subfamily)